MCGIAGFVDRSLTEAEARLRLEQMLGRVIHRGPDGAGAHVAPTDGLAVGMRRLSVIDHEGGAQPIWNEDRTIGVVFNGEIYNYPDLQRQLRAAGHTLATRSDTEVLVHLYEEYGEAMVGHLRGMFAFAIFDLRARRLFIARDHFGQKPLYYVSHGDRFAFASELKSLFVLPWVSRERNPEAFLDYCAWLSLPPPHTHYRQIRKLAAGTHISISLLQPAAPEPRRYWRYIPSAALTDATVEEIDAALRDSVQAHMRADVPLGLLLSGGLDSRILSVYSQQLAGGMMQTFTAGLGGEDSEATEAAKTAREVGSRHHAIELMATDLGDSIGRVAWHFDEPIGDPAAFAVLKICDYARQSVKVLLSGEGADELFAGYDTRYLGMMKTLGRSSWLRPFRRVLATPDPAEFGSRWGRLRERAHHSRGSEAVSLRREGFPGDIRAPRGLTPEQMRMLRIRTWAISRDIYRPQADPLSELLALDLDWQLAESLLQKADKMSMASSIELRTPLLDVRVAEVASRVPRHLKLPPDGPGKLILRQCLARMLDEPLSRPKKGFPVPLRRWLSGPLRGQVEDTIFASSSACLSQLDARLLRTAWDDFLRGAWGDGAHVFYALWLYEIWAQRVVGR